MKENVAAIVVTYNRKKLLKECLESLLTQSYKIKKIYIIDNNSTDGTTDYLKECKFLENKFIELISLCDNTGGAGGFYYGLKEAYKGGYDWYWLMDDDCLPDEKCLENLLNSDEGDYLSPIVLSKEDMVTSVWYSNIKRNTGLHQVDSIAFNGTLIKKSIVDKQGFPMQEFFIFGDDLEYSLRARKNNYILRVNSSAILYHPINRSNECSVFFNRVKIPVFNTKIKQYCHLRNNIYLCKKYGKIMGHKFYKYALIQVWYSIFINRKQFKLVMSAIIDGFMGDFTKTKDYL